MTSSIHLSYLLEQIPYFQGPFITSWLFFESYCVLVVFNYSVVQGEYGLETLWKETQRKGEGGLKLAFCLNKALSPLLIITPLSLP